MTYIEWLTDQCKNGKYQGCCRHHILKPWMFLDGIHRGMGDNPYKIPEVFMIPVPGYLHTKFDCCDPPYTPEYQFRMWVRCLNEYIFEALS